MASKKKKQRKQNVTADRAPSLHERLAVTRLRAAEEQIRRRGEAWAEARRKEDWQRRRDEGGGAKQRDAGHKSPGRRGQHRVPPAKLRAAVAQLHKAHPTWTWNDVCTRAATDQGLPEKEKFHFNYKTAESVRQATRGQKWPDPRRRG